MPEAADLVTTGPLARCLKPWPVPAMILLMAAGIVLLIAGNWNTWANELAMQKTEDAYVRADLASLSTKVAGLVATHLTNSSFAAVTLGKVMQKAGYLLDSETANALPSFRRIQPGVWVVNSGASLVGYFGRLELYNTLAKGAGKSKVWEMVRAIKLSLRAGQDLFSATVTLFLSGFDKLPIVNEAGTISVMYDPCELVRKIESGTCRWRQMA